MQKMKIFEGKKTILGEDKRNKEIDLVTKMIQLYCKDKNHSSTGLCQSCRELMEYSYSRIKHCPFMETKSFCSNCKVQCYRQEMRDKIRQVMRYSGPRMLLYHPILTIRHLLEDRREKRRRWQEESFDGSKALN